MIKVAQRQLAKLYNQEAKILNSVEHMTIVIEFLGIIGHVVGGSFDTYTFLSRHSKRFENWNNHKTKLINAKKDCLRSHRINESYEFNRCYKDLLESLTKINVSHAITHVWLISVFPGNQMIVFFSYECQFGFIKKAYYDRKHIFTNHDLSRLVRPIIMMDINLAHIVQRAS